MKHVYRYPLLGALIGVLAIASSASAQKKKDEPFKAPEGMKILELKPGKGPTLMVVVPDDKAYRDRGGTKLGAAMGIRFKEEGHVFLMAYGTTYPPKHDITFGPAIVGSSNSAASCARACQKANLERFKKVKKGKVKRFKSPAGKGAYADLIVSDPIEKRGTLYMEEFTKGAASIDATKSYDTRTITMEMRFLYIENEHGVHELVAMGTKGCFKKCRKQIQKLFESFRLKK